MTNFEGIVWNKLEPDDNIYRTISFERLVELLLCKKNTLVRPAMWGDPYEDLIGQAQVSSAMKGVGRFANARNYYGQCWTLHKASDAIWQIYSDGTDGYRVRTTVRKLLTSLKTQINNPDVYCHIGLVQYKSDEELIDFGKNHFHRGELSVSEQMAEAYMVKRNAFKHEEEVRLIFHRTEGIPENESLFAYSIDPNDLFDQVMLHPRLNKQVADEKKQLLKEMGFNGEIKRSLLYAPPKNFVFQLDE